MHMIINRTELSTYSSFCLILHLDLNEAVYMHESPDCEDYRYCSYANITTSDVPLGIEFRLFTRENQYKYILLNENAEPVDPTIKVDLSRDLLKVVTHGWISTSDDPSVADIKNAYLDTRRLNIIAVDWRKLADSCYCEAVLHVRIVAKSIARFLEAVALRYGVDGRRMHLIGHSLGAHVVGIAASRTHFRIFRVTGLDPAGPFYEVPILLPPEDRIDKSCAEFVDIIHTCGGLLGFMEPIGHIDFYPNSGIFLQPDCVFAPYPVLCSHAKSYEFYVDTIYDKRVYPAYKCNSWPDYVIWPFGNCSTHYSYMGDGVRTWPLVPGNYYLVIIKGVTLENEYTKLSFNGPRAYIPFG